MHLYVPCAIVLLLSGNLAHGAEGLTPHISLTVIETDPASPATLHNNDNVYVRVGYTSDIPISIWVRPYLNGQSAGAMTSGSPVYPAGQGQAFGWFAFRNSGKVDEIHLQAAPAGRGYPTVDQATSADFTWDGMPGQWHTPAAWVEPFKQKEAEREKQEYQNYMNKPLGAGGTIAVIGFGAMVILALGACFVWPLWGVIRWRGRWRMLAAIPFAAICLWVLKDCSDLHADPTSHNLLPFEFLEAAVFIAPYMLVVWLVRRMALKRETAGS